MRMPSFRSTQFVFAALSVIALMVAGCSKVPQEEIDAVQASLTEVEAAEAAVYAPEAHAQATSAMEAVEAEVAAQAESFALMRSYERTRELLADAQSAATAAREAAVAGREQALIDSAAAIDALRTALQGARDLHTQLGNCRRRPKGLAADLESLGGSLTALEGQLAEAETKAEGGDLLGSIEHAAAAQAQVDALSAEMADAKAKIGC